MRVRAYESVFFKINYCLQDSLSKTSAFDVVEIKKITILYVQIYSQVYLTLLFARREMYSDKMFSLKKFCKTIE